MSEKGRYSPENRLEDLGVAQFRLRMQQVGWITEEMGRDVGEDLLVRIFDGGQVSGVDFYVQHKSTEKWGEMLDAGDKISYPIQVEALKHWRDLLQPVVLVVWDVTAQQGRWLLVQLGLKEVKGSKPNWENQSTLTLHLPPENTTDEDGLQRLRFAVASYWMPLVPDGDVLTISWDFVDSDEGREQGAALERFIHVGDEVTLTGENLRAIELPASWTRLFGPRPLRPESVIVLSPAPSDTPILFRVDARTRNGRRASLPLVEMKLIKGGDRQVTFSNCDQSSPLRLTLVASSQPQEEQGNASINISLRQEETPYRATVSEALEAMEFLSALAEGGTLRLTLIDDEDRGLNGKNAIKPFFDIPFEPRPSAPSANDFQMVFDFFETLLEAENRFGVSFCLPNCVWSDKDAREAKELRAILRSGRFVETKNRSISLTKEGCHVILEKFRGGEWKDGDPMNLFINSEGAYSSILGVRLPLGRYEEQAVGPLRLTLAQIESQAAQLQEDEGLEITLVDAHIVHTFPDWLPEDEMAQNEGSIGETAL